MHDQKVKMKSNESLAGVLILKEVTDGTQAGTSHFFGGMGQRQPQTERQQHTKLHM